jgi:thiamine pyrophosphokinase
MKAVIIANGSLVNQNSIKKEFNDADYLICADGGAQHAYKLGIIPHYIMGDLDSIDHEVLDYYTSKDVEIIRYPKDKDFTDTELCIQKAVELGCNKICLIAALGDRIDHTFGNIGLLHIIKNSGANGYIASDNCYIYLCTDELEVKGNIGDIVSVIPFKGDIEGITLKGLKYPLNNFKLEFGKPLGISNEMVEEECKIIVQEGEALVIRYSIDK